MLHHFFGSLLQATFCPFSNQQFWGQDHCRAHSKPLPLSTASASNTIIATTDASMTMFFVNPAMTAINVSHLLWHPQCPFPKMGLLNVQSETSARALTSNYCTRTPNGWQQCTLPYGPMLYAMRPSCIATCQCLRMAHCGLSFSAQFVLVLT
jgi:hypothetical protein